MCLSCYGSVYLKLSSRRYGHLSYTVPGFKKVKYNNIKISNKRILVARDAPPVALATAASMNGVTSLPCIPLFFASANESLIAFSITNSEKRHKMF